LGYAPIDPVVSMVQHEGKKEGGYLVDVEEDEVDL
jgi:hypothetical protein